jgi:hypothetical protein
MLGVCLAFRFFDMCWRKDFSGMRFETRSLRGAIAALAVVGGAVFCAQAQRADSGVTHLRVTNRVILPGVTRLGINLGDQNYYDSGQMLKNLLYRNPAFAGMTYRSIFHCQSGGQGRCIDTRGGINFPPGFWDGASYEVLEGAAIGKRGTVTNGGPTAAGFTLALDSAGRDSPGGAIGTGDWIAVRKEFPGDPAAGWWPSLQGGARLEAEHADLPPGTVARQALRIEASGPGQSAQINSYFDTTEGRSFLHLRGRYRLSFCAKALAGTRTLHVHVARLAPGLKRYLDQDVSLTTSWAEYHEYFSANEIGVPPAAVEAGLSVTGGSVLLDEVDLEKIDGDPANHTVFRDEVVETLKELRPGVLRFMASYAGIGSSTENLLAPPMARERSGFRTWFGRVENIPLGIPEFLDLCQAIDAEPWIVVPTAMSREEARELGEYLAGNPATAGGTLRAATGQREPWTRAFRRIHIELGNETWNTGFMGETIEDPAAYGRRSNVVFAALRSAAGADAGRLDLVVGTQAYWPGRNGPLLAAATQANSLAIAPYLMMSVTQWANDDQLYGPLMAQPEQMSREGIVREAQESAGGRQLAVYEVNLHTTEGTAPQAVLDRLTPSEAAGVAVAGHMLRMMRDHGVRDQMLFTLPQFAFKRGDGTSVRLWGVVVEMGADGRKRPQFLTVSLANRVIRGDMVKVEASGENPTHDQPRGNSDVQLQGVHELDAYGFQEGKWHGLVVFNYGLHQSRRISLEGPGLNANSRVTSWSISSTSPGATNEETQQVTIAPGRIEGSELTLAPCSMAVLEWSE